MSVTPSFMKVATTKPFFLKQNKHKVKLTQRNGVWVNFSSCLIEHQTHKRHTHARRPHHFWPPEQRKNRRGPSVSTKRRKKIQNTFAKYLHVHTTKRVLKQWYRGALPWPTSPVSFSLHQSWLTQQKNFTMVSPRISTSLCRWNTAKHLKLWL